MVNVSMEISRFFFLILIYYFSATETLKIAIEKLSFFFCFSVAIENLTFLFCFSVAIENLTFLFFSGNLQSLV